LPPWKKTRPSDDFLNAITVSPQLVSFSCF
jgi:hypothetical protein